MKICTFFGHSDCPETVYCLLKDNIEDLIIHNEAVWFYVGNQGSFDFLVIKALKELKKEYFNIEYRVVLAYLPEEDVENSIYPEGLEIVPKRFCIDKRNRWMLNKSDYVVSYVKRSSGGAAKFTDIAKKQNKKVINIAEQI